MTAIEEIKAEVSTLPLPISRRRKAVQPKIWNFPEAGHEYFLAACPTEGIGQDAAAMVIVKEGDCDSPDAVVVEFEDNCTDPLELAMIVNAFGRWYNNALVAVETNRYDSTLAWLQCKCGYENLYRWKHKDATDHNKPLVNKFCWMTTAANAIKLQTVYSVFRKRNMILLYRYHNWLLQVILF